MAYSEGSRLSAERASKLGHLAVINSKWVKSLLSDFEDAQQPISRADQCTWLPFTNDNILPLRNVWAVDGSFVSITSTGRPSKQVTFVKTALLTIDKVKLDTIDKESPHPLLLQDILKESAVFHA